MTPATCSNCSRIHYSDRCPRCKPHRIAAKMKLRVCQTNRCGRWSAGCQLVGCFDKTFRHFLKGGEFLDPDNPLCGSGEPVKTIEPPTPAAAAVARPPESIEDKLIASIRSLTSRHAPSSSTSRPIDLLCVTSLSLLEHHLARQTRCLDSWRAMGMPIAAVNTAAEIDQLQSRYPQVDQWIQSEDLTRDFDLKTQRITSLTDVAIKLDRVIMLINSDIEIAGDASVLMSAIDSGEQVVGIRHNYNEHFDDGIREPYGLDAFTFTPELAASLPRLRFGIGRPMWDYWLPIHLASIGHRSRYIGEPFFFHRAHAPFWNRREWAMGRQWVDDHYGQINMTKMRKALPYPPPHL